MTKNWSPVDLRGTQHLLAEFRANKEKKILAAQIAKNRASWEPGQYKAGWNFADGHRDENPWLNPYCLAVDEFETREDRWPVPGPAAQDYTDASEGTGQVKVCGSDYDHEEPESFEPREATVRYWDSRGGWASDKEATLGFDTESDLVEVMTAARKVWLGQLAEAKQPANRDEQRAIVRNDNVITVGGWRR